MNNILFYDTETTDKADFKAPPDAPHQPHLVQLAAILTTPENEMVGQFCCIIKPEGWTIQPGAQEQHGISQDFAECHGIPLVKALAMFAEFEYLCCGKVCHNTDFDSRILIGAKLRKGIAEPQPVKPHFCTMKATTNICKLPGGFGGQFKWPKLREAYKFATGKELEGAHRPKLSDRLTGRWANQRPMRTTQDAQAGSLKRVVSSRRTGERTCKVCGEKSLGLGWPKEDVCFGCHFLPTCRMCGKQEQPWTWPSDDLCGECARPRIITRPGRKAHCIFGYTHEGLRLTYCGIRWDGRAKQATTEKHCKHCTKELRKAGMSWRWYESQDAEAANTP